MREQIKQLLKNSVYRALGETANGIGPLLGDTSNGGGRSLRVLMYHKVNDLPGNRMSMPVSIFDEQMAQLRELGYTAVDLDAVVRASSARLRTICSRASFSAGLDSKFRSGFPESELARSSAIAGIDPKNGTCV